MLNIFFPSVSREAFTRDYWRRSTPLAEHGDVRRFAGVADAPELRSPESLCRAHGWGTAATLADPESQLRAIEDISWQNALELYAAGATVHLNGINATLPVLHQWSLQVCRELGLLPGFLRCTAFLAGAGAKTPKHFDDKDTFVLQLTGEKRWLLAENTDLESPIGSVWPWAPRSGANHLREMPASRDEILLRPGSVLFVPRGYWHATECVSDSLAITIGVQRPSWSQVLLTMLEEALLGEPAWREPVGSAWGTEEQRQVESAKLEMLLQRLPETIRGLDFARFCEAQDRPERLRTYEVRRGARAESIAASEEAIDGVSLRVASRAPGREAELDLDSTTASLVRWALEEQAFTLQEAAARIPALSLEETEAALDLLVEAGLLDETRDLVTGKPPSLT